MRPTFLATYAIPVLEDCSRTLVIVWIPRYLSNELRISNSSTFIGPSSRNVSLGVTSLSSRAMAMAMDFITEPGS